MPWAGGIGASRLRMVTFLKSAFASSFSSLRLRDTLAGVEATCVSLESWQVCESDLEDEVFSERRDRGRNWDGDAMTGEAALSATGGVPGQSESPESPTEDK